jgi:DNA-binding NtrC family response regulator
LLQALGVQANQVPPRGALVVAADEELRILFRGLLQLQRVRVDAEAEGVTEALRLVREHRPGLIVADTHLSDGTPEELMAKARGVVVGMRFVLIAPASRPPSPSDAGPGPDVLLLRPFRIQQFADAVAPRGPGAPSAPGGG